MSDSIVPPLKSCRSCGLSKPLSEFYYQKLTDSYKPVCKVCARARGRQYPGNPPLNDPSVTQICSTCKVGFPATTDHFHVSKRARHGLAQECKTCRKKRERYIHVPINSGVKHCQICAEIKPATIEYFYPDRSNKGGLQHICKTCDKAKSYAYRQEPERKQKARDRAREWYQNNPEQHRENTRAWLKKNPARAKHIAVVRRRRYQSRKEALPTTFTSADWDRAKSYFGECCAVCGRSPGLFNGLAMDHWIPLASPDCPGTIPTNIVPLCEGWDGCNPSKQHRNPIQWLTKRYGKRKAKIILKRILDYFTWVEQQ